MFRLHGITLQGNGYMSFRTQYDPDLPPSSPNAADDEFDDSVFDSTKWSWCVHGSLAASAPATVDEATYPGVLFISNAQTSETYFMKQSVAIGTGEFEFIAKFGPLKSSAGTAGHMPGYGIFAADASGKNGCAVLTRAPSATIIAYVGCGYHPLVAWGANVMPDVMAAIATTQSTYAGHGIYHKLKRNAAGNILYYISKDAVTWELQLAGAAFATNVALVGLVISTDVAYINDAATNPCTLTCNFFRRTV